MRNVSRERKHICPDKHTLDSSVFLSIEPRAYNILPLYVAEQTRVRKSSLTLEKTRCVCCKRDFYLWEKITVSRYVIHLKDIMIIINIRNFRIEVSIIKINRESTVLLDLFYINETSQFFIIHLITDKKK